MRLPRVLLRLLLLVLACLVVLRAAGTERGTVVTLLVGALPLVLLPAYAGLLVGLVRRDRLLAVTGLGLVAVHLLLLAPALGGDGAVAADAPRLRVAVANLYVLNTDPEQTGRALRALAVDVLVVPELDGDGLAGLRRSGLLADLPHAVVDPDPARETVGLFSRLPLRDVERRPGSGRQLPRATVDVGGRPVRLLTAHTLPPVSLLQHPWRLALAALAGEVERVAEPVVLVGDLNADRDHGAFRALLATGLRDVHDERGRGLARTWPAGLPLLHLDHVLVRDGQGARLQVAGVREVRLPGTDHLAVVTDLRVVTG